MYKNGYGTHYKKFVWYLFWHSMIVSIIEHRQMM